MERLCRTGRECLILHLKYSVRIIPPFPADLDPLSVSVGAEMCWNSKWAVKSASRAPWDWKNADGWRLEEESHESFISVGVLTLTKPAAFWDLWRGGCAREPLRCETQGFLCGLGVSRRRPAEVPGLREQSFLQDEMLRWLFWFSWEGYLHWRNKTCLQIHTGA